MLNPDKTDFVLFGSRPQLRRCVSDSLVISGSSVKRSSVVKHLGVLLDENLTMKAQVTKTCRNASLNLHKIAAIRPYLTAHTAQILIQGLVISHLDYCNICFIGLPDTELAKLQRFTWPKKDMKVASPFRDGLLSGQACRVAVLAMGTQVYIRAVTPE